MGYDAFHGCGKCQDTHKLSCDLPWLCPVAKNQSCVLQQASHIDNAAAVYVFSVTWTAKDIFQLHLFFVRLPMRLAMLSISILPFSEC